MSRTRPLVLESDGKDASFSEGVWHPRYRRLTLGLILLILGPAFEGLAVATILPRIVANLGGLRLYGWSFSAYMLATIVSLILAGDEADRRGPARPFIAGVVLFVLGLILAGTAPSMLAFILSRAVQGLGAGIIASVAYVCLGRGYPEHLKPRMIAIVSSAWIVPGLIGPALAGIIADFWGWRWVFLGLVPVLPVATILLLPSLQKLTLAATSASWNLQRLFAAVGLVIGSGMTLAGLQVPSVPLAIIITLAGLAVGIPSLHRILPAGTLKAKAGLPAAIATMGLLSLGYFGGEAFLPLTLISIRGQNTLFAGATLTAATITWTAGSWLQARLAPWQGRRLLVTSGLLLVTLGLAGIACVPIPGVPVVVAIAAWAVGGFGMGLSYSTISLVVLEMAPADRQGSATASMELASVLGSALGTGLGGVIIGLAAAADSLATTGITLVDILVIAIIIIATLAAIRLPGRPQQAISQTK
ncbi:MAG TPA: MFS transporter [Ktedonobacteraceae bacterium]|nr:MFS transporter [Ktedonobacteraceae bacterium]